MMHSRRLGLGLAACLVPVLVGLDLRAQDAPAKRPLTHEDYDGWKSLGATDMTLDGAWIAASITAQDGDGELFVRETTGDRVWRQPRGRDPHFTADGKYVVFLIEPKKDDVKKQKLDQLKKQKENAEGAPAAAAGEGAGAAAPAGGRRGGAAAPGGRRGAGGGGARGGAPAGGAGAGAGADAEDDTPKSSLGILRLADGHLDTVPRVKSVRVPEEGPSVIAYHLEKEPTKRGGDTTSRPDSAFQPSSSASTSTPTSRPATASQPRDAASRRRQDGTPLVIHDLGTGTTQRYEGVLSVELLRKRPLLLIHASSKTDDSKVRHGLFALDLATKRETTLVKGVFEARGFSYDKDETKLAFYCNLVDWKAEKPTDDVYLWDFRAESAERAITAATEGFPKGRKIGNGARLTFSRDGSVLLLGAAPPPAPDPEPQLADDKVSLDLWSWRDGMLQPMQEKRIAELRGRTAPCAWLCAEKRLVALGGDELTSVTFLTRDGSRVIARDSEPYLQEMSWDTDHSDIWLVNTFDGSRKKVLTHLRGGPFGSPNGRYLTWFDAGHWHCLDVQSGEKKNLTERLPVRFANELWDQPSPAASYGTAGWTENDETLLVQDRYDVWQLRPRTGDAVCVTDGYGRAQRTSFQVVKLDPEAEWIDSKQPLLLAAEDERTRASGLYSDSLSEVLRPRKIAMQDKKLSGWRKPKKAERLFFTASTFAEFPDLWTVDREWQQVPLKLTDANPQQRDIAWGKAELVAWKSADGQMLQGVLVKPDGFDPKKKYPMMVYFYERLSQQVHTYHAPAPGTSPNASYYVSQGYLWFEPDITYQVGYPGDSCFKCLVPGVQSLIAQGFVDENAIGISGHSWGGYQTAYLVTRTNLFKAAEAGAAVSNMTSAYGGIRWSTGMSRAFQYEQTQSRIGATLWDAQMRYLENSPIFFADKVRTPLLLLHNDQDGAVPWYQGIEFFTALRRLGKEVFLFNYNGEDHGLRRRANMKDWTKRMADFFEHHLRGKPAAAWMTKGVPYVERDKEKLDYNKKPAPATKPEAVPVEATSGGGR